MGGGELGEGHHHCGGAAGTVIRRRSAGSRRSPIRQNLPAGALRQSGGVVYSWGDILRKRGAAHSLGRNLQPRSKYHEISDGFIRYGRHTAGHPDGHGGGGEPHPDAVRLPRPDPGGGPAVRGQRRGAADPPGPAPGGGPRPGGGGAGGVPGVLPGPQLHPDPAL